MTASKHTRGRIAHPWCGPPSLSYAGKPTVTMMSRSRTLPPAAPAFNTADSRSTTHTATSGRASATRTTQLLRSGQIIESPETAFRYAIDRLLGEGGFGQVYLANRLGRSRDVPEVLCIKVSTRIDGWLREAYFGQLLDGHPRAIRVFDAFPAAPSRRRRPLLSRPRIRTPRRPERASPARIRRLARTHDPARDRGHPRSARQAASRPVAAPRSHAAQRLRLRRGAAQARRLRHRPAAERSPRHHRADDERAHRAERHPRRRRAEVAGARRRVPGRPADRHADQGRRAERASGRRMCGALPCSDHLKEIVLSLPRRAPQALRERHRADRCAAQPAAGPDDRRAADAERRAHHVHRHP